MRETSCKKCSQPLLQNCLDPRARENSIDHGEFPGHYSGNICEPIQERIRDCRFYLAFENSNCSDYVTEKFANAIGAGAIPIVNGWRDSYEQKLPGSYIHVSDFENLENLSKHLASLLRNEDSFMEYHKWRLNYTAEKIHLQLLCQLCEKLKLSSNHRQSPMILDSATILDSLQNCSNSKLKVFSLYRCFIYFQCNGIPLYLSAEMNSLITN